MSQLRVPTMAMPVEILDSEERSMHGTVYLPAMAHHHEGPTRPDEWINDRAPFFPFRLDDEPEAILLNKRNIVALTVPLSSEDRALPLDQAHTSRIVVHCAGARFEGVLRIDMPDEKCRVLDFANRDERFLGLVESDRFHLIQKSFITKIVEIKEA